LLEFYGKYSQVIQNLNNFLEKGRDVESTRRQIARVYFRQTDKELNSTTYNRIKSLMEENIKADPKRGTNYFLWLRAARKCYTTMQDFVSMISSWYAQTNSIESAYYLYISKTILALDGYSDDLVDAKRMIEFCKKNTPMIDNKTFNHEWYGKGDYMSQIVPHYEVNDNLQYVEGYVTKYLNNGFGYITIIDGLEVYFSPSRAGITQSDLNKKVTLNIGFSYDGIRADDSSIKLI
jgi:hypothetical protein